MVCSENHARGVAMSVAKILYRDAGGSPLHNAVYQSLIHQMNHEFAGANSTELSKDMSLDMIEKMVAKIEQNPNIPDDQKYRASSGQGSGAGLITKLRAEQERIRTGLNENGEPLTNAQRNSMSHLMATMTMMERADKMGAAQDSFVENYARSTGKSFDQAQKEYNKLVNVRGNYSRDSGLRDDWKDGMAFAGLPDEQREVFSQAGRVRNAVTELERRRLEHLDNLEQRDFYQANNVEMSFSAKRGSVRCDTCGWFGHEAPACPNETLVAKKTRVLEASSKLENKIFAAQEYESTKAELGLLSQIDDPAEYNGAVNYLRQLESDNGGPLDSVDALEAQRDLLAQKTEALEQDMGANAGDQIAADDDTIDVISYNVETGVLVRTDRDPDEPHFAYRVDAEGYKEFKQRVTEGGKPTEVWDEVIASNPKYKFENYEDMNAALVQHRCPTCGQWASMNSGHKCSVAGGPTEQARAELAKQRMKNQNVAPYHVPEAAGASKRYANDRRRKFTNEHGDLVIAEEKRHLKPAVAITAATQTRQPVIPTVDTKFQDGHVTGSFTVWRDAAAPATSFAMDFNANPIVSDESTLKCDCEDYRARYDCRHVRVVKSDLKDRYSNELSADGRHLTEAASGSIPGRRADGVIHDKDDISGNRTDYHVLKQEREQRAADRVEEYQSHQENLLASQQPDWTGPTTPDGTPTSYPRYYSNSNPAGFGASEGKGEVQVDLTSSKDVASYLREKARNYRPEGDLPRGRSTVKADPDGTIWIRPTRDQSKNAWTRAQAFSRIAEQFNTKVELMDPDRGLCIQSNTASRMAALEVADKCEPTILGPSMSLGPTEESMRIESTRAVLGRKWAPDTEDL